MKSLLILSPRMPPYNGADAQRARLMLPHLAALGWRATVMCAAPEGDAGTRDDALMDTVRDVDCDWVRVRPWPLRVASRFGLRQHMLRAWWPWRRALAALQRRERFDAVFISHTDFALSPLALRCEAPVVLDWQDPWLSDYHDVNPQAPRPGGRLRYGIMQAIARHYEPRVARRAAAHVVVSPGYVEMLRRRYPDIDASRFTVSPFAASADDRARALVSSRPLPASHRRWWVYAGRGGDDLHFALSALFLALRRARDAEPARYADLGLLFVGTAYDSRVDVRGIHALAATHGIADMVEEIPARVGLFDMYRLIDAAEALLAPGSDDPAYVASKLAPYLLGGKPLLGVFHRDSSAHALARAHGATRFVAFDKCSDAARERLAAEIDAAWLRPGPPAPATTITLGDLEAGAMTARLCAVFDRVSAR